MHNVLPLIVLMVVHVVLLIKCGLIRVVVMEKLQSVVHQIKVGVAIYMHPCAVETLAVVVYIQLVVRS